MASAHSTSRGASFKDPTANGALARALREMEKDPRLVLTAEKVEELVEEEFPLEEAVPSLEDIDFSVTHVTANGLRFENGQWIERLGDDMIWHLEPIRRTIKIPSSDNEQGFEFFFKTSASVLVPVDKARCPEEGLKRHFGMRPWVWQQWANLRVEAYVRFQANHERDFKQVNFKSTASFLWNYWLNHERNADFKALYESKDETVQEKLFHHFMQPFCLMDDINMNWDFESADISAYQYCAFLGSGFSVAVILLCIQLVIPFLLLDYAVRNSNRFPNFANLSLYSWEFSAIWFTTWPQFCDQYASLDELVMNFIVFLIYSIRVLPDVYLTFYETIGDLDNVSSRLNSIRLISWLQGDDTPQMQIGYRLYLYMNTAYLGLINCVILVILFLTNSTVDIILNALAIEFVASMDEEVASYLWYDRGRRYLTASVLEIIICGELRLEFCRDNALFCENYDIDPALMASKIDGPLSDLKRARVDGVDPKCMLTDKDRLWLRCSQLILAEGGSPEALWQFLERKEGFGFVDKMLHRLGYDMPSIFMRYEDLYTWSRWDEVLWLARLPPKLDNGEYGTSAFAMLASNYRGDDPSKAPAFAFFNPESSWTPLRRFIKQVVSCFRFANLRQSVGMAIRRKFYIQVPIRVLDGLVEIFVYGFICGFPCVLLFYAFLIFSCLPVQ